MPQKFKQDLFFGQLNGFYFFISRKKATPLGGKRDKTHIHNSPEHGASAQFMHARQLLTATCGIIYCSVGFPSGKELALL
jgi:hypothetical protein